MLEVEQIDCEPTAKVGSVGETDTESRSRRLVAAVESSLVSTWRELTSASPIANLEITSQIIRYATGAPFPILNGGAFIVVSRGR